MWATDADRDLCDLSRMAGRERRLRVDDAGNGSRDAVEAGLVDVNDVVQGLDLGNGRIDRRPLLGQRGVTAGPVADGTWEVVTALDGSGPDAVSIVLSAAGD